MFLSKFEKCLQTLTFVGVDSNIDLTVKKSSGVWRFRTKPELHQIQNENISKMFSKNVELSSMTAKRDWYMYVMKTSQSQCQKPNWKHEMRLIILSAIKIITKLIYFYQILNFADEFNLGKCVVGIYKNNFHIAQNTVSIISVLNLAYSSSTEWYNSSNIYFNLSDVFVTN